MFTVTPCDPVATAVAVILSVALDCAAKLLAWQSICCAATVQLPSGQLAAVACSPLPSVALRTTLLAGSEDRFSSRTVTVVFVSTKVGAVLGALTTRSTAGSTVSCRSLRSLVARSSVSVVDTSALSVPAPTVTGVAVIVIVWLLSPGSVPIVQLADPAPLVQVPVEVVMESSASTSGSVKSATTSDA